MGTFTDLIADMLHAESAKKAAAKQAEAKAARESESAAAKAREADLAAKVAQTTAALAAAERALKVAERREHQQQLDVASRRIAAERSAKGKRALDPGELRTRAALALQKLDDEQARLGVPK